MAMDETCLDPEEQPARRTMMPARTTVRPLRTPSSFADRELALYSRARERLSNSVNALSSFPGPLPGRRGPLHPAPRPWPTTKRPPGGAVSSLDGNRPLRPSDGPDRQHRPLERVVDNDRGRQVPGQERGDDAKPPAELGDPRRIGEFADREDRERRQQEREDRDERPVQPERRDPHVEREDRPGQQVGPDGYTVVSCRTRERIDVGHEPVEREPERTVTRERRRPERIPVVAELPHAS